MASVLEEMWALTVAKVAPFIPKLVLIVIVLVIGALVIRFIVKLIEHLFAKVDFDRGLETFIENLVRVVLWIVLGIIILSNLGVNVSALVAGLGIMGFVVGFALKDTLGNLASGVFILFYKPFRVHDWVKVGGIVGEVIRIGIAACEFRSPDQVKITIPNNKIWGDVIENYTGNKVRKMYNLEIGISYDADVDKAIQIVNRVLKKDKRVLKDPEPQIVVKELSDSAVVLAIRPSMKKEDFWGVYFDNIKAIKEEFDKNSIGIPFPQRDVWIKEPPKKQRKGK